MPPIQTGSLAGLRMRVIALGFVAFVAGLGQLAPAMAAGLGLIEERLRTSYPEVRHVGPEAFSQVPQDAAVVVDVREAKEFAVSHLPGAIRVDPETSVSNLLERIGDVAGRRVVFYCSVGVRSSKLAEMVRSELTARGAVSIENLSGGIFRWHNEQRQLVRGGHPTDVVHPYSSFWSLLIKRREGIAYAPRAAAVLAAEPAPVQ